MNRVAHVFSILLILVCIGTADAQWDFSQISGWNPGTAYGSSTAYLSSGYPVVAWGTGYSISLARWNGTGWALGGWAGYNTLNYGWAGYPRIMVTSDNQTFVAYRDYYNNNGWFNFAIQRVDSGQTLGLQYYYQDFAAAMAPGSTGNNYTIHLALKRTDGNMYYRCIPQPNQETLIEITATPCDMVADASGHLHLAFVSNTGNNPLKYGYYDGTTWSTWVVGGGIAVSGTDASITLRSDGTPEIFVRSGSGSNYTVKQVVVQR